MVSTNAGRTHSPDSSVTFSKLCNALLVFLCRKSISADVSYKESKEVFKTKVSYICLNKNCFETSDVVTNIGNES